MRLIVELCVETSTGKRFASKRWAAHGGAHQRKVHARLAKTWANDILLDVVKTVRCSAYDCELLLPWPIGFDETCSFVDVPNGRAFVVRIDKLNGVGVVRVYPECQLLGFGQNGRIVGSQRREVRFEICRIEVVVIHHAAHDVFMQQRVERTMIKRASLRGQC